VTETPKQETDSLMKDSDGNPLKVINLDEQVTTGHDNDGVQDRNKDKAKETGDTNSGTGESNSSMDVDSSKQSETSQDSKGNVINNPQKSGLGGTFQRIGVNTQGFIRMKNAQNTPRQFGNPYHQEYRERRIV
jgi:hypothetical protein